MASASAMPISAMTPGPYYSIDVECVATTMGHNGRAIAQISLIDQQCNCVLNLYVKPDVAVTSYMTPLTGVTEESLSQYGIDLPTAIATLKQHRRRPSLARTSERMCSGVRSRKGPTLQTWSI
jgi:RNA exonuclease 4